MTWRDKAFCRSYPPEHWFPTEATPQHEIDLAISICNLCPVRERCKKVEAEYGIFGGELRELDFVG